MRLFFLSIIIFSAFTFSQSFSVKGRITDTSGAALSGVNVYLEGEEKGSATNHNGFYEIKYVRPGNYILTFSIVGYESKKINIKVENKDLELNVSLGETPIQSEQVVVTAGKYEQKISELPVSADVIPADELGEKNVVNLKEILRYMPGINMVEDQISIRGSSGYSRGAGTRVLTAIDGIPFYTGDTGEIIWEAVPTTQIERVEIIKGAASSLYGSTAIGGVINIIIKDIPEEPKTYIRTLIGLWDKPSHNQWEWSDETRTFYTLTLSQTFRFEKFGIALSLTRFNDMNYKQSGFFNRYIGFLKSQYNFSSSSSITLFINSMNHRAGNFLYWKDSRNALVPPDADQGQTTKANRLMLGLLYKLIAADNLLINIRSSFYRTHWLDETSSHNTSTSRLYRTEVQTNLSLTNNLILVSGIEGTYSNVRSNIFGNPDSKVLGLYTQADIKFDFPLTASIGFRYDYSKLFSIKSFSDFSPKGGLNYRISKTLVLRSSFGTGFRAPSLAETFTSTTASGITVKPNPALKPEKSISAEAGANYQLSDDINFDAALFNNEFYDFIEASIDPRDRLVFFNNVTRARIQGAEINSGINFLKDLNISFGYTYLWSRDLQKEKALKYRPRHLFYISTDYSFRNFEAGADFRYWSRIEEIDEELVSFIRDGEKRVEVYVIDLRGGYNFQSLGIPLRLYFNADNILNYNYVELVGNIAPIRNYSLGLEIML
jgi:iron complex outermembrane receptor protein